MNQKTRFFSIVSLLLLAFLSLGLVFVASAVDTQTGGPDAATQAIVATAVTMLFTALAGKYGWMVTILIYVGIARMVFKPLIAFLEAIVKSTPGETDDEFLAKCQASAWYRWLWFLVDLVGSIKPPSARTTNPALTAKQEPDRVLPTAPIPLLLLTGCLAIGLTGCARFTTKQTDASYEAGKPIREVTTRASAWTFFSAKSQLANFKASQTDKTQGASVGTLVQEGGQTNQVNDLVGTIVSAAVKGAVGAAK